MTEQPEEHAQPAEPAESPGGAWHSTGSSSSRFERATAATPVVATTTTSCAIPARSAPETLAPAAAREPLGRRILATLRRLALSLLIFAVTAELCSLAAVHFKSWPSSRPTYHLNRNLFWEDINPSFGVWHAPNSTFFHQMGCFSVQYTTNSYGARDVERSLHSSAPRTVMLGDSFIEGLGLADRDRLSNILERDTGREHLNFGTGGNFSPLQYALLYKSLASNFDHNEVLVGVLPDNDFFEMDLDWGRRYKPDRYRPYYTQDLSVAYLGHLRPNAEEGLSDRAEAILRAYLASYHVGQYMYSLLYWQRRPPYSGFNDYTDVDLTRLKKSLEDIKATADAHHARAEVFLIPRYVDFTRYRQGADRLGPVMEAWGAANGIAVNDLLPPMDAASGGDLRSYFLPCDGHWSPRGAATAAQVLEPWIAQQQAAAAAGK